MCYYIMLFGFLLLKELQATHRDATLRNETLTLSYFIKVLECTFEVSYYSIFVF